MKDAHTDTISYATKQFLGYADALPIILPIVIVLVFFREPMAMQNVCPVGGLSDQSKF